MSVNVKYKDTSIVEMTDTGTKTLKTAGKYCEADIVVENTKDSGSENVEWHQCPELVRNYLANVTYDPSDYTTSQIANYAPATAVESNYRPIGVIAGAETYYNQVPNIQTPFANSAKSGTLKPLDQLRWIKTTAQNVRDLGGWTCDGGTVKYGLLFRGGYVTSADRAVLVEQLGIRHELDLRGSSEGGLSASPLGNDVRYTCAPAYAWYALTPTDAWKTNLRTVFDAVTHNEPVYFHCAAGADRTGTLACIIEGLLGMSQSDIDKDYELTSFYSGTDTDANARRRNETDWTGLVNAINAKSGSTFRDKCVTFAAELGFTAAEINAFRAAMIDGTPETVTPSISTFTVTNTLTNATSDNSATSATQYQPYEAEIEANEGYVIDSVSVTMNGVDITNSVWSGSETQLYRSVTNKLTGCISDNARNTVIDGQSYAANITADVGYTLDGATVTITMGGADVSTYYSDGKIAIPNVAGNIEITISAVESAVATPNILTDSFKINGVTNLPVGYTNGKRLSTATGEEKDNVSSCVTGFIPVTAGSVVRIKPLPASAGQTETAVVFYDASKAYVTASYIVASTGGAFGGCTWEQESDNVYKVTFGSVISYAYVRFGIPIADGANAYVTYDAEMSTE